MMNENKNMVVELEEDMELMEELISTLNCITVANDGETARKDVKNAMNFVWYAQKNVLEHMYETLTKSAS